MANSDFTSIRDRLLAQQHDSKSQSSDGDMLWDESRSRHPNIQSSNDSPGIQQQPTQNAVAGMLQQRSYVSESADWEHVRETPLAPVNVDRHLHRLEEEARKINELARLQEAAISKFCQTVSALDHSLMRAGGSQAVRYDQYCELKDAAIPTIFQDDNGRYILETIEFDLYRELHDASQNAQDIRSLGRARATPRRDRASSLRMLAATPLASGRSLLKSLIGTLEASSTVTALDMVIWFGGGLIGRVALELILSAVPGLFPWFVGLTIGAVALALYRFLFSARPDSSLLIRLFFALVGLAIGSQF